MWSYILKKDENNINILVKRKCGDDRTVRSVPPQILRQLHSREGLIHSGYIILHFAKNECDELDSLLNTLPKPIV